MTTSYHFTHAKFEKSTVTGKEKCFARQPMWTRPRVNRIYSNVRVTQLNGKINNNPRLQYIALNGDTLIINGYSIPDYCTSHKGMNITWKYGVEGFYTSGTVDFHSHMIGCYGNCYIGKTQEDSKIEFFSAGTDPVNLNTKVSITGQTPGNDDHWASNDPDVVNKSSWLPKVSMSPDNLQPGPKLQYYWDTTLNTPVVKLSYNTVEYDYDANYCLFDIDKSTPNHNLIFSLSEYEDAIGGAFETCPVWPFRARIEFDALGESFTGWITEIDHESDDKKEKTEPGKTNPILYYWIGKSEATRKLFLSNIAESGQVSPDEITAKLGDVRSSLDGSDLLQINVASIDIQCESWNLIAQNMTWSLYQDDKTKDWGKDFIGTTCPSLGLRMLDNIRNDIRTDKKHMESIYSSAEEWYRGSLAMYWIGWGIGTMSGQGAPKNPLNSDEQNRFKYWNTGAYGTDNRPVYGLPAESYYSTQTRSVYNQAFFNCAIKTSPNLERYLEEQNQFNTSGGKAGHDWATWYYNVVSTPSMLAQQVIKMKMSGDTQMVNTYSSLLGLLDPPENHINSNNKTNDGQIDESKAASYYKRIMSMFLNLNIENVTWQNASQPDLAKWIEEILKLFCDSVITSHNKGDPNYQPGGKYYHEYIAAKELENLREAIGAWSDLAGKLADCIIAFKQIQLYPKWLENVTKLFWSKVSSNPKVQVISETICKGLVKMAITGFAVWGLVLGYRSWDKLSDVQKASVVMGSIGVVFISMQFTLDIYESYLNGKAVKPVEPTSTDFTIKLTGPEVDVYLFDREARARESLSTDGKSWEVGMAENIKTDCVIVEKDGTMVLKEGSWFKRMVKSGSAGKVMQGIGAVIGIVMTIIVTIQFIEDMKDDNIPAYEKAFDAISYAAGLISLFFQVAAFVGTVGIITMTAAAISICAFAAEIFALVAIAFVIVFICCMPKPPSPADKFMDSLRNSAWYKALRSIPAGWNPDVPYVEPETAKTIKQLYAFP